MTRPTKEEAAKMKARIEGLIERGFSINEIARATGKSQQAVQQYLSAHGLKTFHMEHREKTLTRKKSRKKVDARKENADDR